MSSLQESKKQIFITIYYDDFARYFFCLEKYFVAKGYSIVYLCNEISGLLYLKRKSSQRVVYAYPLSDRIRYRFLKNSDGTISDFPYYKKLAHKKNIRADFMLEKKILKLRINKLIGPTNDSYFILSGDARFLESCIIEQEPRAIYFEQGPFNTTCLNSSGVNSNCSRDGRLLDVFSSVPYEEYLNRYDARSRGFYRVMDFLLGFFLYFTGLRLPHEKVNTSSFMAKLKNLFIKKKRALIGCPTTQIATDEIINKRKVLFVLQVEEDVNNICHNPFSYEMQDYLALADGFVSQGMDVVFRLHPLESHKTKLYCERMLEKHNYHVSAFSLDSDIDTAEVVVCVNSTVGIEAYLAGKRVVCLGNAYWDSLKGVHKVKKKEKLIDLKVLEYNSSSITLESKLYEVEELLRSRFVPGHFRFQINYGQLIANYCEEKWG